MICIDCTHDIEGGNHLPTCDPTVIICADCPNGICEELEQLNAEQVCEMMDMIAEGSDYAFQVNVEEGFPKFTIGFSSDRITFYSEDGSSTVLKSARNAREIAGALVTWANRRDVIEAGG